MMHCLEFVKQVYLKKLHQYRFVVGNSGHPFTQYLVDDLKVPSYDVFLVVVTVKSGVEVDVSHLFVCRCHGVSVLVAGSVTVVNKV